MTYFQGTVQAKNLLNSLKASLTSPFGETLPNAEISVNNTNANGVNQLNLPVLSGGLVPSGWRIYRANTSGQESLIACVPGNETTYYDDGTQSSTTTIPPSASYGTLGQLPSSISASTTANPLSGFIDLSFTQYNNLFNVAYDNVLAQPFIANKSIISGVNLPLDVSGTPTGNVIVSLYPSIYSSGSVHNVPNSGTSATPIAQAILPITSVLNFATNAQYTNFVFNTPANLIQGMQYFIVASLDTSSDTVASGKVLKWHGYNSSTSLTTGPGNFYQGNNTVFTTGTYALGSTANASLGFQLNAIGSLSAGQYYYVITAVTGFVYKNSINFGVSSSGSTNTTNQFDIYYCSGDGTANFYQTLGFNNANNNVLNVGILEKYSTQTALLFNSSNLVYTNGTAVLGQTYQYNYQNVNAVINTNVLANTTNITFRLHQFLNHFIVDVAGDSANTGFQESVIFAGMMTPKGTNDKPYILTGNNVNWYQLRDFNNAVNIPIYPLQLAVPSYTVSHNDSYSYINKYNNQYEGSVLYLTDANGIRGSIPNMLLFPSAITNVINNHDNFTVNGITYQLYLTYNDATYPYSYYYNSGNYSNFYPAFSLS